MSDSRGLFFVAVIPPEPVLSEIRDFKLIARERFNSQKALRSPAHITLFPPFRYDNSRIGAVAQVLEGVASRQQSFRIELNGFGCFTPRVIYVLPEDSAPLLQLWHQVSGELGAVDGVEASYRKQFHPHLTVAFRDLTREMFIPAWEYFKSVKYQNSFEATGIALLVLGDHGWSVLGSYEFGG